VRFSQELEEYGVSGVFSIYVDDIEQREGKFTRFLLLRQHQSYIQMDYERLWLLPRTD